MVGTYVALGVVRRTSIGLSGIRRLHFQKKNNNKTKYIYLYTTGLVFPLNVVRMKSQSCRGINTSGYKGQQELFFRRNGIHSQGLLFLTPIPQKHISSKCEVSVTAARWTSLDSGIRIRRRWSTDPVRILLGRSGRICSKVIRRL